MPPTVLRVDGIEALEEEIFGPVLHVATYDAERIDAVVEAVNASGYGLTFGLHTRIDDRVQHIVDRVRAGNIYVNRNQIGAVVGSQPFGGEGASGTGPKAGGPHYLRRLTAPGATAGCAPAGPVVGAIRLAAAVSEASRAMTAWPHRGGRTGHARPGSDSDTGGAGSAGNAGNAGKARRGEATGCEAFRFGRPGQTGGARFTPFDLPGPTGESNRLSFAPRGVVLCLGPGAATTETQIATALDAGNAVVAVADRATTAFESLVPDPRVVLLDGRIDPDSLVTVDAIAAVACSAERDVLGAIRKALARRPGPILPLITEPGAAERYVLERHVCVDTTAAGGNATLLALADG